ncbi:MAG TPA: hypothetical protein VF175_04270, partial [Lacipirellula sp.]
DDAEYQVWDLPYIPRWLVVLMFLGIFFLLTAPFVRQRCKVKAGLSKQVRRRRGLIKMVMALMILSPVFATAGAILTMSEVFVFLGPLSVGIAYFTVPCLVLYSKPMRVRWQEGQMYWVDGFSSEFLSSLNQDRRTEPTAVPTT